MTSSPGLLALLLAVPLATAPAPRPAPDHALARAILKELVEIDTTDSTGDVTRAAEAAAARLRAAGFPAGDVRVDGPLPRKRNLVARLRGTGKRPPILLLAHLDVVEARRSDWSPDLDPFTLTERDGFFYGRGTSDVKHGASILLTTLIDLRRAGFVPDRDVILALTADEEGGESNGVAWLLANHREWIDAAYCVNTDGGDFQSRGGQRRLAAIQASEKLYVSVDLTARDAGGHSSLPGKENAIVRLAGAVTRLAAHTFPASLNDVTRGTFERMARFESAPVAADMKAVTRTPPDPSALARLSGSPYFNALLRTTCVPTLLAGGHARTPCPSWRGPPSTAGSCRERRRSRCAGRSCAWWPIRRSP